MGRLDGKIAVITGATSGIGEATVDAYCAEGAKVVFCGRNEELGKQVEERQPDGTAVFVQADVLHEEEIAKVINTAVDRWGRIDVLFNNAGGRSAMPGQPHAFNIEDVNEESFKYSQWYLLGTCMVATKLVFADHAQATLRLHHQQFVKRCASSGSRGRSTVFGGESRFVELHEGGSDAARTVRDSC